ncbi:hypothetical protein [Arcanobacterium canis]
MKRIELRHPEISRVDVLAAFHSVMFDAQRADGTWMSVGLDGKGRNIELLYGMSDSDIVIYHACTPPTKKF